MISLLDVAERSQKGPKVEEKTWNLGLFRKMEELARKYGIKCPNDGSFFNQDDGQVEAAYHAALDFLTEQGVYCLTTNRVIQLTREEVLQAMREAPAELAVGTGRDVRVMRRRNIEEREALNHVPAHHAPFSEQMAPLCVKNMAQIPSADLIEGFNFRVVDGREIYGMPMEAYAARRQLAWVREGIRKAGRPGMAVAFYPISTRASVLVAPMDPDYGLRRTDGILLSTLPDVKVEQDMLTAAIVYTDYGSFTRGTASGMAGGFCGSIEGAVVEGVCRLVGGWICYRNRYGPASVSRVSGRSVEYLSPHPDVAWGTSLLCQTLNRYCPLPLYNGAYTESGPGTLTQLLELAYNFARGPLNGASVMHVRHQRAQVDHAQTPLEAEWTWEVCNAVMRSVGTRSNGDAFYQRLGKLIEGRKPEPARDVREVYDWAHHRPSPAYHEVYLQAKQMLSGIGLDFE
ncbi:MAG: monomethylamine:corrinoid methyltransferase [Chloroflexi bacterium]|nr:monomethylamine:corrinoid methyltransferase [Chloroflexota bacterium]